MKLDLLLALLKNYYELADEDIEILIAIAVKDDKSEDE